MGQLSDYKMTEKMVKETGDKHRRDRVEVAKSYNARLSKRGGEGQPGLWVKTNEGVKKRKTMGKKCGKERE